jgi:hypothetical protein
MADYDRDLIRLLKECVLNSNGRGGAITKSGGIKNRRHDRKLKSKFTANCTPKEAGLPKAF